MLRALALAALCALTAPAQAADLQPNRHHHHRATIVRSTGVAETVISHTRPAELPQFYRRGTAAVLPMVRSYGIVEYEPKGVAAALPYTFLAPTYYQVYWATLGLEPPPPGYQWVRAGRDLVLVHAFTADVPDYRFMER